jgi:hypothetical protein
MYLTSKRLILINTDSLFDTIEIQLSSIKKFITTPPVFPTVNSNTKFSTFFKSTDYAGCLEIDIASDKYDEFLKCIDKLNKNGIVNEVASWEKVNEPESESTLDVESYVIC